MMDTRANFKYNEQVDDEGDKVYLELLERNSVTRENFS